MIPRTPLQMLRHHVTGAIERGEAVAIKAQESTMNRYRVTWTIDIEDDDVNTRVEAAERALKIQRDPDSIALVFEVADDDGDNAMMVDLADGSVVEAP